jgi:hypothetical protein
VHFSIGSGTRLAFGKILATAHASSHWYERLREKMTFEPWQLAYDDMTRSGI